MTPPMVEVTYKLIMVIVVGVTLNPIIHTADDLILGPIPVIVIGESTLMRQTN